MLFGIFFDYVYTEPNCLHLRHKLSGISPASNEDEEKKLSYGKSWSSQAQRPGIKQLTWILGRAASLRCWEIMFSNREGERVLTVKSKFETDNLLPSLLPSFLFSIKCLAIAVRWNDVLILFLVLHDFQPHSTNGKYKLQYDPLICAFPMISFTL